MEFTFAVTGLPHATPGEVLLCQIDERDLNGRARPRSRSRNAEWALLQAAPWLPLEFRRRLFLGSRTIGSSDHAKLRQPCRFISRFDAARKDKCAYARCRVYNSCDNLRRSHLRRHRVRADAREESFDPFFGATGHRSKTGLKLSSISRCVHRRDRFIVAVSRARARNGAR